jgi:branched-chain amino acid transport system substrate-binding protein
MLVIGCTTPAKTATNSTTQATTAAKPEIKVGNITDLTGPSASLGKDSHEAIVDLINYQNSNGGIEGSQIKLITIDCGYDTAKETAAYRKLADVEKVTWLYGWNSTVALAFKKELIGKGVISYSSPDIKVLIPPSNVFSPYATYVDEYKGFIQYFNDNGGGTPDKPVRIAYLCFDAHPKTYIPALKDYAAQLKNVKFVKAYVFPYTQTDFSVEVLDLIKENVDVTICHILDNQVVSFNKDAARLGWKGKQSQLVMTENSARAMGTDISNGIYCPLLTATWDETSVEGVKLIRKITEKYHPELMQTGRSGNYILWSMITMLSTDAAAAVIKEKGIENLNGANLTQLLESGREFTSMGLMPTYKFSATYHGIDPSLFRVGQFNNAKAVAVSDWIKLLPKTDKDLTLDYYKY